MESSYSPLWSQLHPTLLATFARSSSYTNKEVHGPSAGLITFTLHTQYRHSFSNADEEGHARAGITSYHKMDAFFQHRWTHSHPKEGSPSRSTQFWRCRLSSQHSHV